jgi:hypothetical protein
MDRPWYSSGDGELLAVLLCHPKSLTIDKAIPSHLEPYVTQWGADPMWTHGVHRDLLSQDSFSGDHIKPDEGFSLEELQGKPRESSIVRVVAYKPQFDHARRLWYCDIAMQPGTSYYPFVRLALARYQPDSLDYVHLSRVVLADFAQLTPDRHASAVRTGDSVLVTLTGIGFQRKPDGCPRQGSQDPNYPEITVTAHAEELSEYNANMVGKDLAWLPVPGSRVVLKLKKDCNDLTWTGKVLLPPSSANGKYRVVVTESETYLTAYRKTDSDVTRVVYADSLEL